MKFVATALSLFQILSFLLPTPVQAALPAKAKITSCLQPKYDDRPKPIHPMMRQKSSAPTVGSGAVNMAQPAPAMEAEAASPPVKRRPKGQDRTADSDGKLDLHQAGKKVDSKVRKASQVYLSNDDSMSLASAQRMIYAIENFLPLYRNEIRPHEFLNYFNFKTDPVVGGETFSVNFQIAPREKGQSLGLAVQGKPLNKGTRQNAVITFILDKSGSMRAHGKMAYLKEGLETLKAQLKEGDVLNVIEFDHEVCNAIEGFVVGRDAWTGYDKTVEELGPRGSTNLHAGLVEGYRLAEQFYQPGKLNRVILITDAIANTGTLSPELMASIGKYYDSKKIALSGIGVGLDFNDELLDTLTDKGKGAYLFLGIKQAIPRVFGDDFVSLLETVARNVHFQATFPENMHLDVFYGEEVSTEKAEVQAIHYFANTSQLFLLDLIGKFKEENPKFTLKMEFEEPSTGNKKVETVTRTLSEIQKNGTDNVNKARLIMAFADLLEKTALPGKRPYGGWWNQRPEGVKDKAAGKKLCTEAQFKMKALAAQYSDGDTKYVMDLADKYCSRY